MILSFVKKTRAWTAIAFLASVLPFVTGSLVATLPASKAEACRDCPFPLKVGHDRWLMPNGKVEVQIREEIFDDVTIISRVILIDVVSREVVAVGHTKRKKTSHTLNLNMTDHRGGRIKGQVRWSGDSKDSLQARFSCVTYCSISDLVQ
jgi:hypothetical protein